MENSSDRHVVFGAGAVGRALVDVLVARGRTVVLVDRTGRRDVPSGVEVMAGDVHDRRFAVGAAQGAAVVYQVLNPGYHRWAEDFPSLQDRVLTAAEVAGARLVTLENVYAYGRPGDRPFTEDHPNQPCSTKGFVRAQMSRDLLAAHAAGRLEVAVGRASDYFGPGGGAQSPLGDRVVPAVLAGKPVRVLGDPDLLHTYTFLPDIAEGLAVLGEHPAAAGRVWHLPNDPDTRTTRQIVQALADLAGRPGPTVRSTPRWLLRVLGILDTDVREVVEMLYEFELPFVVDSSAITRELGVHPTPMAEALAATLDSYRPSAGPALPDRPAPGLLLPRRT